MKTSNSRIFLIIILTLISGALLFSFFQQNTRASVKLSPTPITNPAVEPTTSPIGEPVTSVMDSPEGSKTLTLISQSIEGQLSYNANVSPKSDPNQTTLFYEKPSTRSLSIPFNTWSSTNTFVFLKDTSTTPTDYLVFKSDGTPFVEGRQFVSVQEEFVAKLPNFVIEDVTGWAGPTSLIVNTKSIVNGNKVSFWFEVPSKSFIQLGTYFK